MDHDEEDDKKKATLSNDKSGLSNNISDQQGDPAARTASESGDAHPVFGNTTQPQALHDQDLIGTSDDTDSFKGEETVVNFDPEIDTRMQEPLEEE